MPLNYRIQDLLDIPKLQILLDSLSATVGIPTAIIDLEGNILTKSGWQEICTKFHRTNPQSERGCIESNKALSNGLSLAGGQSQITCPHGLTVTATPLIIEGVHLANVFNSQFFFAQADRERFRRQAREFGFDEEAYLAALDQVPVIGQAKLGHHLLFIANLAETLANQALNKLQSLDAQQAIREREERYREIIEHTPAGYFLIDLEGRFQRVNSAWLQMHGYDSSDEVIGHHFSLTQPAANQEIAQQRVGNLLAGDSISSGEACRLRKDGSVGYHTFSAHPVIRKGEIAGLEGFIIDTTEHKRREEVQAFLANYALGAQAEPFFYALAKYLAQTMDMDFVCIDRLEGDGLNATTLAVWSDGHFEDNLTYALADTPCGELVGKEICCFPADVGQLFPRDQVLKDLHAESYVGVTLFDLAAQPIGLIAVIGRRPLQNRKLAETILKMVAGRASRELERLEADEALRQSEERFRLLFENDLNAVAVHEIVLDDQGNPVDYIFLQANPAFEKHTGICVADILGKRVTQIHPGIEKTGLIQIYGQVALTGVPTTFEFFFELQQRHYSIGVYQVGKGRFAVVFEDISERKQSEEEKDKLQAQLNQAQKMEAIGVLAGGIAHDFNNILAAIIGYSDMAREDVSPDSPIAKDLDRVLTSAHRAKELVKQILAFSRQSTVDRMAIKIQPLIKESLKMLRASLPSTIAIKEDISPQCGAILADPTQIHQIVMNLCTNAFHALETTGGLLSIEVNTASIDSQTSLDGRDIPPGEYVELTVSDTGTGIGPDVIDKIFDPYFTTKDIGKGTGMGLSISHGIIKSYGGAITVESTLGQGTAFHIYFPVIAEESIKESEEPQKAPHGQGRILFVDDEELLVVMGKHMLERLGYTVTTYTRSIEALAAFMDDPARFDLVITDQTMPGLTGTELAKRMLMIRPELPIILCTGFSHLVSEESAKAIGIRAYALKPLTNASIAQLAAKVLQGEGSSP